MTQYSPNCLRQATSRCRHAANIAFDLFNIFLYVIARKVRKCPLSPFVTSYVVLSCLVRMADILARLVQKADSLSALQLTGAFFTINWGSLFQTHLPPSPHSFLPPASAPPPPPPPFGLLHRPCNLSIFRSIIHLNIKLCKKKRTKTTNPL